MLLSTEAIVGEIWSELLNLDKVNAYDNFFEIGGDSLMTLTMLFNVGYILEVKLRPDILMDAPTLGEFCQIIDRKKSEALNADPIRIIHCERKGRLPVSFIQEQIISAELAGLYNPEETRSYCLDLCYRIKGLIDISVLDKTLCEIVRRHEILRTNYSVEDGTIFQNVNDAPQSLLHVEYLRGQTQDERELV